MSTIVGSTAYGQNSLTPSSPIKMTEAGFSLTRDCAAGRRYLWIDRERWASRAVSYGGQLTDLLITQTNEFKPRAIAGSPTSSATTT